MDLRSEFGVLKFDNIVMVPDPSRFYHAIGPSSAMEGSSYTGKEGDTSAKTVWTGSIEWVAQPMFCEMKDCPDFASWRIRYGSQSAEFCPRHALSTMRNRRLWSKR